MQQGAGKACNTTLPTPPHPVEIVIYTSTLQPIQLIVPHGKPHWLLRPYGNISPLQSWGGEQQNVGVEVDHPHPRVLKRALSQGEAVSP